MARHDSTLHRLSHALRLSSLRSRPLLGVNLAVPAASGAMGTTREGYLAS
jgi:hypothetical protein